MDAIGLLSAWLGVTSLLVAIVAMAVVQVREALLRRTAPIEDPNARLIQMYGGALLTALAAATIVIVSIELMDLAPALLAATLPFPISAKALTRSTGIIMLVLLYYLLGRLCYLAVRIRQALSGADRRHLQIEGGRREDHAIRSTTAL